MADQNSDRSENPNPDQNKNPIQGDNLVHNFLYLNPNENLVTPLVFPILDSTNYHS